MENAVTERDRQTNQPGEALSTVTDKVAIIPSPSTTGTIARMRALFSALRPRQWTKNLAIFAGIVFAQRLLERSALEHAVLAFVAFCFACSAIYLLNDLLDLKNDRQHPVKRARPLASGRLPISWAIAAMGVLLVLCVTLTFFIFLTPITAQPDIYADLGGGSFLFALSIGAYLLMMVLYSTHLKHVVLLDVFIIASGFVLRILAGAVVIPVTISPWLYLVAILLSLFLALSKRRHELMLLQGDASNHRAILKEYSLPMLDQMITIVTAATLMAYSLYTFQGPTGNHRLMLTIPLVLYGMFRYLYLVHMHMEGGSPEEVLLRDRHMLGTVVLCTAIIIAVLYVIPA
ncbi:MAG: decaprenyl-phosphate phosphoribosyltransferase [Ktedonobacteraceae bacterium]|nr:decaprenyl-phosphate phosphoribosyltransferase [Chloroflexota bacterium]